VASAGEDTLKLSRNGLRIPTLEALVLLNTTYFSQRSKVKPGDPECCRRGFQPVVEDLRGNRDHA
jgi:hypothetical protein